MAEQAHTPGLSAPQRRLLRDMGRWGEVGPDAEDVAGCHGAAFNKVLDALIRKGMADENGGITPTGRAAIAKASGISTN